MTYNSNETTLNYGICWVNHDIILILLSNFNIIILHAYGSGIFFSTASIGSFIIYNIIK